MSSLCYIIVPLALGQNFDSAQWLLSPQYVPGLELVYRGICTDESLVPGIAHQKQYDVEVILFTQNMAANNLNNAVLQTSVSVHEPKEFGARNNAAVPGSVRLDLVQIGRRGALQFRDGQAANGATLAVPLDGPPLVETGAFFDAPLGAVNRLSYWEEHEDYRPKRGWHILLTKENQTGIERYLGVGVPCLKLRWSQESPDWKKPRADSTAWRRQDTLWFAYQSGQVVRVERVIERRDPGRTEPTRRITTKYELSSGIAYRDRFLEDRNDEIARVVKFQTEAAGYLQQPADYRKHIDSLIARIAEHVDATPFNPYRKAMLFLKSKLEHARSGELPVHVQTGAVEQVADDGRTGRLTMGERVPDFVVTELTFSRERSTRRFHHYLGQPILVLYYDPARENCKEVLRCADKLACKHGDKLLVVGMAVTDDADLVRRQHTELGLSFPILDGKGMLHTFGVDGTPRIVLLDADGRMRYDLTGWGLHCPAEVAAEVGKLIRRGK